MAYIPKKAKVIQEIGTFLEPVSIQSKHTAMLNWVADSAEELIDEHGIMPMRAIASYMAQAEGKFQCQWVYGIRELQTIAEGGVKRVREYATKAKYLRGLDE